MHTYMILCDSRWRPCCLTWRLVSWLRLRCSASSWGQAGSPRSSASLLPDTSRDCNTGQQHPALLLLLLVAVVAAVDLAMPWMPLALLLALALPTTLLLLLPSPAGVRSREVIRLFARLSRTSCCPGSTSERCSWLSCGPHRQPHRTAR